MGTDFRHHPFNSKIQALQTQVMECITEYEKLTTNNESYLNQHLSLKLRQIEQAFNNYYSCDRRDAYPSNKEATGKANTVFSEFLQSLICFSVYIIRNGTQQRSISNLIADQKKFLFKGIVWIDPEKNTTIVHAWSACNDTKNLKRCFGRIKGHMALTSEAFQAILMQRDKQGSSSFHIACQKARVDTVKLLLEAGKNSFLEEGAPSTKFAEFLTSQNIKGFAPLNAAVVRGDETITKELLEAGKTLLGNPKIYQNMLTHRDSREFHPLYSAICHKYNGLVSTLLSAICETFNELELNKLFSERDKGGNSLLNLASRLGDLAIVQSIGDTFEKIYAKNHLAILKGLLTSPNKEGFSPLIAASKEGHLPVVQYLIEKAQAYLGDVSSQPFQVFFNHLNNSQFSAFTAAVKEDHTAIVEYLLGIAKRAFINQPQNWKDFILQCDASQYTALHIAVYKAHIKNIGLLLQQGLEMFSLDAQAFWQFLTQVNKEGFSPLHSAACSGDTRIVNLLLRAAVYSLTTFSLENKIIFDLHDSSTNYIHNLKLYNLRIHNDVILQEWITHKGQYKFPYITVEDPRLLFQEFITHKNKYGFSPLMVASKAGHLSSIKLLMAVAEAFYHCDERPSADFFDSFFNQQENEGYSALNSAIVNQREAVALYYLDWATEKLANYLETFKTFIMYKNKKGFSPLLSAVYVKNSRIICAILTSIEKFFNPEDFQELLTTVDHEGYSSLHWVADQGSNENMELLLTFAKKNLSANNFKNFINVQNKYGSTPLNAATRAKHLDTCHILLQAGAHLDIPNNNGYTAGDNIKHNANQNPAWRSLFSFSSFFNSDSLSRSSYPENRQPHPRRFEHTSP
jgi:ankyrin repeat protein